MKNPLINLGRIGNMVESFSQCLGELFTEQHKAYQWATGSIHVSVATSLSDDESKVIDLTPTLGHNRNTPQKGMRNDTNCYWLSSKLSQNNDTFRKTVIYPIFVRACTIAGFKIFGSYSDVQGRKVVYFLCFRSQYHDEKKNKIASDKRNRVKTTNSPFAAKGGKSQKPIKYFAKKEVNKSSVELVSENQMETACGMMHDTLLLASPKYSQCLFNFCIYYCVWVNF